jgi:transporter family protein
MSDAYVFAFLALGTWGLWGLFSKLATEHIRPSSALLYEIIGSLIVTLCVAAALRFRIDAEPRGILFAVLTGVCVTAGSLFFLIALSRGNAPAVTVITALYPAVTLLLLFFFLREPITLKQGIAMALALAAMILFAI